MARRTNDRYGSRERITGERTTRSKTYASIGQQRDDLLRNPNITPARAARVRAAARDYQRNIVRNPDYQRSRRRLGAQIPREMQGYTRAEYGRRFSAVTRDVPAGRTASARGVPRSITISQESLDAFRRRRDAANGSVSG